MPRTSLLALLAVVVAVSAGASSLITPFGDGRVAVRAERVLLGQLLQALDELEPLDHLRVDPALRGERLTVHLQGISKATMMMEVLQASGIDYVIWDGQIILGNLEKAVPFRDVAWARPEEPQPAVSESWPALGAARPEYQEGFAPAEEDDPGEQAWVPEVPESGGQLYEGEPPPAPPMPEVAEGQRGIPYGAPDPPSGATGSSITPEMRAAYEALPLDERAEAAAEYRGRPIDRSAPDPAAVRALDGEVPYVTPEFTMVGESVTYSDPTFVPYKNRPEVRARRMNTDISAIP